MNLRIKRALLICALWIAAAFLTTPLANAQTTLGGITGTVTDTSGAVVVGATVSLVGDQTKLSRSQTTNSNGTYLFVNLPIGNYTLSITQAGFQSQSIPSLIVQEDRTLTVNAELKIGNVSESITVEETPLINMVDTTNGYVMDKLEIDAVPLATGSFTRLTILSPGVNAELSGGTGANSGLGNAPVWANGQRDTSNDFLLNGVDARSLFNGKSTSQVLSARIVNVTGVSGASGLSSIPVQSSASVYLAIGESMPTPAPESIQEVRVNTSMYDAQQGSTSGAHVDMSTGSGTNNIHGQAYVHRGTNWLNADPYFYNADPNIPASEKNPGLHRYSAGATIGLPIKKDKLFFYGSYQYTHASDDETGISRAFVPPNLTNDRSLTGLATAANTDTTFASPLNSTYSGPVTVTPNFAGAACGSGASDTCGINPIAYTLFNYKFPNGQYLIPSANPNSVIANPGAFSSNPNIQAALINAFPEDAEIPGTALFRADQGVADLDWNPNSSHSFSAKYYYQYDPTTAPYAYSMVAGFTQHLDAGSQVISLSHTQVLRSNLSITETFGFIREKTRSTLDEPFSPAQFASACESLTSQSAAVCSIDTLGSYYFPGMSIVFDGSTATSYAYATPIGAGADSQGALTGVFQNRFNPSANAIWTHGKHTITFGGSFSYTQINAEDNRNEIGTIAAPDFTSLMVGDIAPGTYDSNVTALEVGNPNRYFRANESGEYVQDKYQMRSNLSITAGLRWDWDGGLTEKYGNLLNFDPSLYNYNPETDTIVSNGLIVAGNNPKAATPGVSNSTLTGRQWGFAPRFGVAWSPKIFNSKVVVRAGWGMYYDRGELYSYLSPGDSQNITTGGPFGVNASQPFVTTLSVANPTLENPWGTAMDLAAAQPTGNPKNIILPNACALATDAGYPAPNTGCVPSTASPTPFYMGPYSRANKLPYTMNAALDIQWQPRNDLAIDVGYVNALGRHEVIPIPFNQARLATPTNPVCGPASVCPNPSASPWAQSYSYGFTVQANPCPGGYSSFSDSCPFTLPNGQPMLYNPEGGNVDLRVPYIGIGAESESFNALGVSAYNALQTHIEKKLGHGLQAGISYTFSRSFDEQSAMGLFYNGDNPLNVRSGYGPSDFDRTHVFNADYHYELPKFFAPSKWEGKVADGWGVQGVIIVQSGQPFSVIDYSGAVGSVYYSYNSITNPIVPLNYAAGCTPQNAVTGYNGATPGEPALKASCFTVPLLTPSASNGVPVGDDYETNFTSGQRNIFRQTWQKNADISLFKVTPLTERFTLKYTFDVFNLTNTPSFDIPIDNVTQNLAFSQFPQTGTAAAPTAATCAATSGAAGPPNYFFNCPGGLGQVTKTIGSSRQVQMSLSLVF